MSAAASELKEVKCIIRGLIISSPLASTIYQLESDYRKEEGCGIPFQKFGYPSIEAFLRSIPDTVCLTEPRRGCPSGSIIVQPVQSEKSGHVEKLVCQQRRATNAPRRMKRASAVSAGLSEKRSNGFTFTNGLAPSFVPMSLRVSLSRVCRRYAENGLPLSSLSKELSTDLYMAGYIQDERSRWLLSFGFNKMENMIEAFLENGLIKIISRDGQPWIAPSAQKLVQENVIPAGQEENLDYDSNDDSASLVSDRMKSNFKAVLKKNPEGLWCSHLPKAYRELTGYNLEVNELGFVSIIQMAMSLKDVFICSRPNRNSDWLLFDADSNSVWNSPAAPVTKEIKRACLPTHIIHNIQALLEDFPAGIIKHKFLMAYKEKFQEELPMSDFGFDNLMAILAHLASRNVIHLRFSGNLPMICSPFSNPGENTLKELRQDKDFITSLYPREVLQPSDDIPVQPLPENFSVGCSIDILVTEVITPSFFWYQLWGSDVQAEFNEMMDELQKFYNSRDCSHLKMPDATIQIGQYCAARYPPDPIEYGEWHRTQITSLPSLSEVEVFYIDYGSKCKVLRSEILFLDKKYGRLPMQAHKASLVNVRPHGFGLWLKSESSASNKTKPVWSPEACNTFLKLVENQPMVGVVAGLEQDFVTFALIDTSKDNDLHINDILVYAKLAEFGEISEINEHTSRSCSRSSNGSTAESLNGAEAEAKLPGFRPSSIEENITSNMNFRLNECSLNRTLTSPMSVQNSTKGDGGETDKFPSESDAMLPVSARASPMSLPSSLGKDRSGPEHHLGRMTSSPKSVASSPISPFPPAERSMFGSDIDNFHLGSTSDSPRSASSPRLLSSMDRSSFGPGICETPLEPAVELLRSSTVSPMLQQNGNKGNVQVLPQGDTPINLEGSNHFDDKALKVQLELERLQLCQQQLQYQQFQTQLLLMAAAQNSFMLGMPTVPNPLQARKVVPPPPGLPPLNPISYSQPNVMDLSSSMLLNPNLLSGFQSLSPLSLPQSYGNFPLGNNSNSQFPSNSTLNQTNEMGSLGSSVPLSDPTSFGNKNVDFASSVKSYLPNILPDPSLLNSCLSRNIPDQQTSLEKQQDCKVIKQNTKIVEESDFQMNLNGVSVVDASYNSTAQHNVDFFNDGDHLSVGRSKDKIFAENKMNYEQKSEHQTLYASTGACSTTRDSIPSSLKKYGKRDEEKWKVLFEVNDNDDEGNILNGIVNGKPVQVLRIGDMYYVLTEEILGLFHSSLPVHVAMKIAKLKPNGKKIESIIINARKNKEMYKRIQSLAGIELMADGSDIHLTSVDSLQYLCSSLELSD